MDIYIYIMDGYLWYIFWGKSCGCFMLIFSGKRWETYGKGVDPDHDHIGPYRPHEIY